MRLRKLLMLGFFFAAAAPAIAFMFWVKTVALDREKDAVEDKHLTMARHLAATAEVLAQDRIAVLEQFAETARAAPGQDPTIETAAALGFRHLCVIALADGRVVAKAPVPTGDVLDREMALDVARMAEDTPRILPGRLDLSGRPTLFIVLKAWDGVVAIGAVDPRFVAELGGSVEFGERGHAVIVDQAGQALAHPLAAWRQEMRNISAVKPVTDILQGREGVVEFHSPAIEEDMIAGYAVAPGLRWGAMVVQPVAELHASAGNFFEAVFTIAAPVALLIAIVVGALTARMIARPVERVANAAQRFGDGDHHARAPKPPSWCIDEMCVLAERFNAMADAVAAQEKSLEASLERATVADQAKTIFLANMSHELRTPLNAVIGFSEVISTQMMGPIENQRYLEYADDISRSARHLLALINDVLDLSTVEADRLAIDIAPTQIGAVMGLAARQIAPQADAHKLRLIVDGPTPEIEIAADERRVLQILLNLLSNAVRFSPPGGQVRLSARRSADKLQIIVADTGIGMTAEQAALAIEPFGQPHLAADPTERGCGLGLPLARRLAMLHGGDLSIESAPGEGCRVVVALPIAGPGQATASDAEDDAAVVAA